MWNTYRDAIPGQVQERIRQIETKELRKLRHASRSRKLRAFLDATVRE
jgi:DNA-directed RNA polymerase sigma subunit (sigma70/sigma32)